MFTRLLSSLLWLACLCLSSVQATSALPSAAYAESALVFSQALSRQDACPDCFHVVDIGQLEDRMQLWQQQLPQVVPFYAIKTNNDPILSTVLAQLGAGFDCASQGEIAQILALGVLPSRIIFAHTRKPACAIKYAYQKGVRMMTFDSSEELDKMLKLAPQGQFILRIKTEDSHSSTPLSAKFGASFADSIALLDYGLAKKASIVGISFHVGSSCKDINSYTKAIYDAAQLFAYSKSRWGVSLHLLDLGGGWPGNRDALFIAQAEEVRECLKKHFPADITLLAEPGRFFSTKTTSVAMRIIGKTIDKNSEPQNVAYYLTSGIYGFFYTSLYFQYDIQKILASEDWVIKPLFATAGPLYSTTLWGPTCDSADKIFSDILLPALALDDFLLVENIGAYGAVVQTTFNQIPPSVPYYITTKK